MEENKIEVKSENCEAKKGHCFGFKCHGGADCGHKCHKIAKISLVVLAALALLGIGASLGRHGERGDSFSKFDRSGINQERSGCGAQQGNFQGGKQPVGRRGGRGMMRGNAIQAINNGNQINVPTIQSATAPSSVQVVPAVTSTPAKTATQAVPVK